MLADLNIFDLLFSTNIVTQTSDTFFFSYCYRTLSDLYFINSFIFIMKIRNEIG